MSRSISILSITSNDLIYGMVCRRRDSAYYLQDIFANLQGHSCRRQQTMEKNFVCRLTRKLSRYNSQRLLNYGIEITLRFLSYVIIIIQFTMSIQ